MTEPTVIREDGTPELTEPVLIEGLPGVGNVGKLAAEYLISKLEAKKMSSIYSKHFPPQVLIGDTGVIRLVSNDLYYHKKKKGEGADLIILTGDYQGTTQEGQYELAETVLDIFQEMGGSVIYTLGGWSVGKIIKKPRVLGATTSENLVTHLKDIGVSFSKDEPSGGIMGAAGLLLGLGKIRGIDAACLMGETSGYFSDPKSAQAVLQILVKALKLDIDFSDLEERSKEIEELTAKLDEATPEMAYSKEDLNYFG